MDEKTLNALKASIRHWRDVVDNPLTTEVGPQECALCALFLSRYCQGCPVREFSGHEYCCNTPYGNFATYQFANGTEEDVARQLATNELSFLERLLPEGEVA